jgi:sensor histidine kinase regulating citrate/malate metabolism
VSFHLPLKLKLSLLITGLVVLAVVLVSASLIRRQARTLTEAVTKRGLTISSNLAGGAKSALVSNDDLTLNILVKEAMSDKDVAYVVFADEHGVGHGQFAEADVEGADAPTRTWQ